MRETFQSESERIERVILDLSNKINEICEADIYQDLIPFSITNGANTGQYPITQSFGTYLGPSLIKE
ncbi:31943_t:CDS:2 [Gigaspora margarita]|uniref:31943_t:CDS:1 n=1 Tax=Gigaspora margarita TaxID=4874 RepID=A0ABM8VZJ6_GIGMA|nr:31943_t:CDS:2 [Gigaspora margarita]